MITAIAKKILALEDMTIGELREKYRTLFKDEPRSYNKRFYVKRIAWRLQATEEGGLSERARRRAAELANENDLRILPPIPAKMLPQDNKSADHYNPRLPIPGTIISRKYKHKKHNVTVLEDGFEYDGQKYRSLSAIAKVITGSHWNGFNFFGFESRKKVKQ